jgi:hypothetical protein
VQKPKHESFNPERGSRLSTSLAACATAAGLLLSACASQGGSEPDMGGPGFTPSARAVDTGGPASACTGTEEVETEPDAPAPPPDGKPSPCSALDASTDWSSVPVLTASSRHGLRMRVRNGSKLDVCIEGAGESHYELYIDTDGNASTGAPTTPWRSLGAEYKVTNNVLYGPSADYKWPENGAGPQVATRNEGAIVVHIDKALLPGLKPHFAVAFRRLSTGWQPCGWLPGAANHPVRLQLPSIPANRSAQQGLIIPIYALVPGVISQKIDRTLSAEQCTAINNGDTSIVDLLGTRRGDVVPEGDSQGPSGDAPGNDSDGDDSDGDDSDGDDSDGDDSDGDDSDGDDSDGDDSDGDDGDDSDGDSDGDDTDGDDSDGDDSDGDDSDDNSDGEDGDSVRVLADVSDGVAPNASSLWTRLAQGAKDFGAQTAGRDYWVAVSGPSNGPFVQQADFVEALKVWQPIQANGAKIFGYVKTHTAPSSTTLRPLCEAIADVVRWKKGYPEIDGIWIDEYYPQHESVRTAASSSAQVDPKGGYYAELVQRIHGLYPDLKLIGNVGALLVSNRLRYGELVDVACTIENNQKTAALKNWSGLTLAPIIPTYAQLSLIHGFSTDKPCGDTPCPYATLKETVKRSFEHGYSHVFITDAEYEDPEKESRATAEKPGLWQDLPPFFEQLVSEVAGQISRRN